MTDTERASRFVMGLGDDLLILGHRLSEWCGHGPYLEEDIALGNLGLDCLGQAQHLLQLAGDLEGQGRDADRLAYFRNEYEFRNCLLVEQPNGDFAVTIARQLFYDQFLLLAWTALQTSTLEPRGDISLGAIAQKAVKETRYHVRHAREWTLRLGGGTEESHRRMQTAVNDLWAYTPELFETNDLQSLIAQGICYDPRELEKAWQQEITAVLNEAGLTTPTVSYPQTGGRSGRHSEHLGHLLSQMQIVARSFPNAEW